MNAKNSIVSVSRRPAGASGPTTWAPRSKMAIQRFSSAPRSATASYQVSV